MQLYAVCLVVVVGLTFGSFLNVVGLRIPQQQSIVTPPSHCPICHVRLTALDLIPVVSYVVHRGQCRHCGARIAPLYIVMEGITAFLFVHTYIHFGGVAHREVIIAILLASLLVIITVTDVVYGLIPNRIVMTYGVTFVILRFIIPVDPWWDAYVASVVGSGILAFVAIVSKGGIGGGDVKLYVVIGLALGTQLTLVSVWLAVVLGALYGLFRIAIGKANLKTKIPFGPAIALGTWIAYTYGESLIRYYVETFFL